MPSAPVPGLREARRLAARAYRARRGRFLAEGPQAVREALRLAAGDLPVAPPPGVVVHRLYVTDAARDRHPRLAALAAAAEVETHTVTDTDLSTVTDTVTAQGVVAVCAVPAPSLGAVLRARPAMVTLLAHVRDPGNAGTVIRCTDAAGGAAVLLSRESVDAYNPKAVRAAVGSHFHLPVVPDQPLPAAVDACRAAGLTVIAADGAASGAVDLDTAVDGGLLGRPVAWMFGNEAWGLRQAERDLADAVVAVPLHGLAESLNLATAAAVCLYATARAQRG